MKKLTLILTLFFSFTALAQFVAYPAYLVSTNSGTNWFLSASGEWDPVRCVPIQSQSAISQELTNNAAANIAANFALLTTTNPTAASTNYAAWYSMFTNIPAGINDSSNRIAALGVIYTNLLSGTNTQAQDNAQLTQMAHQQYYSFVYLNQIIAYLSRLGPGLQQIYQPTNDPVGP